MKLYFESLAVCVTLNRAIWADLESVWAAALHDAAAEEWRQEPIHNITRASSVSITLVNPSDDFYLLDLKL